MKATSNALKTFSEQDIESFKPEMKIGLLATITEEGLPHLTLISTLQASSPQSFFGASSQKVRAKSTYARIQRPVS